MSKIIRRIVTITVNESWTVIWTGDVAEDLPMATGVSTGASKIPLPPQKELDIGLPENELPENESGVATPNTDSDRSDDGDDELGGMPPGPA